MAERYGRAMPSENKMRLLSEKEKLVLKKLVPLVAASSGNEEFNTGMRNFLSRSENLNLFSEDEVSKLSGWYPLMSSFFKNKEMRINSSRLAYVERDGTVCRAMLLYIWNYICAS